MLVDKFAERYKGVIEDLIDDIEAHVDELYLNDAEWDKMYEKVIDPLTKAMQYLDEIIYTDPDPIDDINL